MNHLTDPHGSRLCKQPQSLLDMLDGDCDLCTVAWNREAVKGWKEAAKWSSDETVFEMLGVNSWSELSEVLNG